MPSNPTLRGMPAPAHHLGHGLFVERVDNGAVRVTLNSKPTPGSTVVVSFVLEADAWCSAVAAVSAMGLSEATLDWARDLHDDDDEAT